MGFARWDLLNILARQIGAVRYLEIGVQSGNCFSRIECPEKIGVDPAGGCATVKATSDAYFSKLSDDYTFVLVFVDGLHLREQVCRDIVNAWEHLTPGGAILVHDCDPPTEQSGRRDMCGGIWCGDVWRGWMDARHQLGAAAWMGVVETDLGCGLVLPGGAVRASPVPWSKEETDLAGWEFFTTHRREWLNLVSVDDFRGLVSRLGRIR